MGAAERERLDAAKNNMASVGWGKGDESMQAQEAVLVAERELAAADGGSYAEVIDLGVTWDSGAPMPQVISGGSTTAVLCYASEPRGNAEVDTAPTSVSTKGRSNLIRFTFSLCSSIRFGAPNDEVLHGHPLYGHGLQFYQAHIVRNSTWLTELNAINSAHSHYRGPSDRTHFLFAFHDETFEAIADDVRVEEFEGSMKSALAAEAARQTSWDLSEA
ncbi:MAG TPA: hypothetical protein VHZ81_08285 [Galbitalea sp.]|jgi:hypothetical protein|nr:hypothetical protein [Galbitalea sp.]